MDGKWASKNDASHGETLVPTDTETGKCSWIGGSVRSPNHPAAVNVDAHDRFDLLSDGWNPISLVDANK
jgi:hypothetical protein